MTMGVERHETADGTRLIAIPANGWLSRSLVILITALVLAVVGGIWSAFTGERDNSTSIQQLTEQVERITISVDTLSRNVLILSERVDHRTSDVYTAADARRDFALRDQRINDLMEHVGRLDALMDTQRPN